MNIIEKMKNAFDRFVIVKSIESWRELSKEEQLKLFEYSDAEELVKKYFVKDLSVEIVEAFSNFNGF